MLRVARCHNAWESEATLASTANRLDRLPVDHMNSAFQLNLRSGSGAMISPHKSLLRRVPPCPRKFAVIVAVSFIV